MLIEAPSDPREQKCWPDLNYNLKTYQVSEMFKPLQDNFLMAELFDVELVEVVDGDVEQATASHIVVDEIVAVGIDRVVQAWNDQSLDCRADFKHY